MDGSKLNFFNRVFYSIAGFSKYIHLIREKVGKAVLYLIIFGLVLGVVSILPSYIKSNDELNTLIKSFDTSVPDFSFENGKLDVKGKMPIIIDNVGSVFIIDTSGKTDESIMDNYDNVTLVTSDRMIQKTFANKQITEFSILKTINVTKATVKTMLPMIKVLMLVFHFFALVFFVGGRFLIALILSLFALILNAALKTALPYRDIFKLSIYVMTLPMLLGVVFDIALVGIPYFWAISTLIFYVVSFVYLWGAFTAIKSSQKTDISNL
jgi:hypothetical protein